MSAEFTLIQQYFNQHTAHTDLGIGDDAALLKLSAGHQLVVSTDTSVVGTHFFADAKAEDIGWKSLAVNVSDMAAMGARGKWATLALTLPESNDAWLHGFAKGFFECANTYGIDLIGGDTTRGPLNIGVTMMGEVATNQALLRSSAKVGDDIWVSGVIGNAALGLQAMLNHITLTPLEMDSALQDLHRPQPRVALGISLIGLANSCIDVSDGLLADLSHILSASKLGANIDLDKIPCMPTFAHRINEPLVEKAVLAGGDDYELCFTASAIHRETIKGLSDQLDLPLSCIGKTIETPMLNLYQDNTLKPIQHLGYQHFE